MEQPLTIHSTDALVWRRDVCGARCNSILLLFRLIGPCQQTYFAPPALPFPGHHLPTLGDVIIHTNRTCIQSHRRGPHQVEMRQAIPSVHDCILFRCLLQHEITLSFQCRNGHSFPSVGTAPSERPRRSLPWEGMALTS